MNLFEKKVSKLSKLFCDKLVCPTHLLRDILILGLVVFFSALLIASNYYVVSIKEKAALRKEAAENRVLHEPAFSEEEIYQEVKTLQETMDTTDWKNYQNRWYGFALKYPADWELPLTQRKLAGDKWEARYQFRFKEDFQEHLFSGFDVVVYDNSKVTSLFQTPDFPKQKTPTSPASLNCQNLDGHVIETGDYPAEEIYIGPEDDCYEPTLFFNFTKGSYTYTLIPIAKTDPGLIVDPRVELTNHFPQIFSVISTLSVIDIVRPKPAPAAPPKPKINAPYPVSYKKENGLLVCAKKNDKPSKSATNKKKHLDMECCLDPDEYPNPHCSYLASKYQKYLK